MHGISLDMTLAVQPAVAQRLVLDSPTMIGGIETVCTGAGLDVREDPRWNAYGLEIEFASEGGKHLGSEVVTLRKDGNPLVTATCDGPWFLFRLAPGRCEMEARIGNQIASSAAFVPPQGQDRVILRFHDAS